MHRCGHSMPSLVAAILIWILTYGMLGPIHGCLAAWSTWLVCSPSLSCRMLYAIVGTILKNKRIHLHHRMHFVTFANPRQMHAILIMLLTVAFSRPAPPGLGQLGVSHLP